MWWTQKVWVFQLLWGMVQFPQQFPMTFYLMTTTEIYTSTSSVGEINLPLNSYGQFQSSGSHCLLFCATTANNIHFQLQLHTGSSRLSTAVYPQTTLHYWALSNSGIGNESSHVLKFILSDYLNYSVTGRSRLILQVGAFKSTCVECQILQAEFTELQQSLLEFYGLIKATS